MGLVKHKDRCPRGSAKVVAFIDWWDVEGPFPIVILRGATTDKLQLEEYAKGRKHLADGSWVVVDKAAVVTNALRAADSAHGHAAGIDAHPVREFFDSGGVKSIYLGDEKDPEAREEALRRFATYDELAREHGLEAGDRFPGLCDRPHVADPAWKTLPLAPGVSA
jgi:hypothetical protein